MATNIISPVFHALIFLSCLGLRAQVVPVGTMDMDFAVDGVQFLPLGAEKEHSQVFVVLPDESILAAGKVDMREGGIGLVRLAENGQRDMQYGFEGIQTLPIRGDVRAMALQEDGKVLVAGYAVRANQRDFMVMRIDQTGQADLRFGRNGRQVMDLGAWEEVQCMVIQKDGKIVLAGTQFPAEGGKSRLAVARLSPNGRPDLSFGFQGICFAQIGKEDVCRDLEIDTEGNIWIGAQTRGDRFYEMALCKLNPDGYPDVSFNYTGTWRRHVGTENDYFSKLEINELGQVSVLGHSRFPNGKGFDLFILQLDELGYPIESYGQNGIWYLDLGREEYAVDFKDMADGTRLICASTNHQPVLIRVRKNELADPAFGYQGMHHLRLGGRSKDGPHQMSIQEDGKILLSGIIHQQYAILRVHGNPAIQTLSEDLNCGKSVPMVSIPLAGGRSLSGSMLSNTKELAGEFSIQRGGHSLSPIGGQAYQQACISFSEDHTLSLIWDDNGYTHYYVDGQYMQSVGEGEQAIRPTFSEQKPMRKARARQNASAAQRGLH